VKRGTAVAINRPLTRVPECLQPVGSFSGRQIRTGRLKRIKRFSRPGGFIPQEIFFGQKGFSIPADCWWVSHNANIFLLVPASGTLGTKNQIKYVRCFCNLPPPNFPGWIRLESSARGHHLTPHCPLNFFRSKTKMPVQTYDARGERGASYWNTKKLKKFLSPAMRGNFRTK